MIDFLTSSGSIMSDSIASDATYCDDSSLDPGIVAKVASTDPRFTALPDAESTHPAGASLHGGWGPIGPKVIAWGLAITVSCGSLVSLLVLHSQSGWPATTS